MQSRRGRVGRESRTAKFLSWKWGGKSKKREGLFINLAVLGEVEAGPGGFKGFELATS